MPVSQLAARKARWNRRGTRHWAGSAYTTCSRGVAAFALLGGGALSASVRLAATATAAANIVSPRRATAPRRCRRADSLRTASRRCSARARERSKRASSSARVHRVPSKGSRVLPPALGPKRAELEAEAEDPRGARGEAPAGHV